MKRLQPLVRLGGIASLMSLVGVTILAFRGLAGFDGASFDVALLTESYTLKILRFSLWQAALSTLISVGIAWPMARLIYRLRPAGIRLFQQLCLLAFVMPTLVVITSVMVLFGPQGALRPLLSEEWKLFGLSGILIAHVYLNAPLALRVLLERYQATPEGSERLASQLKLSRWHRFKLLEWPQVRPALMNISVLIFILCFNSFAVVLALGGGPASTTFELAIYQALKYQFNLSEALTLAWMQFTIAGALFALAGLFGRVNWIAAIGLQTGWQPALSRTQNVLSWVGYLCAWLLLLAPILALIGSLQLDKLANMEVIELGRALLRSLWIGCTATLIALALCIALLPLQTSPVLSWLSTHHIVAPAMVLSSGIYIWLLSQGALREWSMAWLILLNSLLILPFLITQLRPSAVNYTQQYEQLLANLKLGAATRLSIYLSYLARPLISALALGLLLALGDVSVFALFGHYDEPTLPWLIYRYAGSYRLEEASIAATLLLLVSITLVRLLQRSRIPTKG